MTAEALFLNCLKLFEKEMAVEFQTHNSNIIATNRTSRTIFFFKVIEM